MVTGFTVSLSSLTCNMKHESSLLSPANIKLQSQGGKKEQTMAAISGQWGFLPSHRGLSPHLLLLAPPTPTHETHPDCTEADTKLTVPPAFWKPFRKM